MISIQGKTLALFFYLMFTLVPVSESAEWSEESRISVKEEVNDNLQMTPDPHPTVRETLLAPSINMGMESENLALHGGAALAINHFDGANDLDTIDQNFSLMTRLESSERTSWALNGGYLIDSTLGSELKSTGVVLQRTQRNNGSASVSWRRNLLENTGLEWSWQHVQVSYAGSPAALFNYFVDSGRAGLNHQLTEKNQINGDLSYSLYRIPDQNYHSWTGGVRGGIVYSFTERLKGTFSGGYHQTGSSAAAPGIETPHLDSGWLLSGDLEGQTEQTILHGGYSREVQASGGGSLVQVDHLFTEMNQKLSDRGSISLGVDFYRTLPFREELIFLKSNYGQIRGGWIWEWREHWELDAGYSWSAQKNEAIFQMASSNTAYLKVTYNAPKWSLSQ